MKNQIIKLAGVVIACAAISACDADFDNPVSGNVGNSGSADLTTFVTIGDSLTAGYADKSLYLAGQENSYPAILAKQFAVSGGSATFEQPWVSDNLGGLVFGGSPADPDDFKTRLVLDLTDPTSPSPVNIEGTPTTEVFSLQVGPFNNMGVPGAKSFHLGAPGYGDGAGLGAGTANPYFVRFASSTATTMITDAAAQQPSFYVMWIGNNDVLSYATTGGTGVDRLGNFDPTSYGSDDITDPNVFAGTYASLVGAFTAANPAVQGVLVNIPDVSTLPYFTTVPYNPVPLDQATADALNAGYLDYNNNVAAILAANPTEVAKRTISFSAGQNAVVILDENLTDLTGISPLLVSMRQATADDLLVLTTSSIIGELVNPADDPLDPASLRWGISAPLQDGDVLIPEEIALVDAARTAFNATIAGIAAGDANLITVDSASVLQEISTTGIDYGTGAVNSTYATGGAFSLDGVHPTARGYAVMANAIIDAINTGFNASIPRVDPGAYTTIFAK